MDQPEAVHTIPQRKSLVTEHTADAGVRRLYWPIPVFVPPWFELAFVGREYVPRAVIGFASLFLASANQERAFPEDDMGEYK